MDSFIGLMVATIKETGTMARYKAVVSFTAHLITIHTRVNSIIIRNTGMALFLRTGERIALPLFTNVESRSQNDELFMIKLRKGFGNEHKIIVLYRIRG